MTDLTHKMWIGNLEGRFEVGRADLKSGGEVCSLKGRFEAWRAELKPGVLI